MIQVLILGRGGSGKSTLGKLLSGEYDSLLDLPGKYDESLDTDTQHGGGHIACVVIGPKVRAGAKSTTLYQHQNVLKTVMKALGLSSFPGAASNAAGMTDVF